MKKTGEKKRRNFSLQKTVSILILSFMAFSAVFSLSSTPVSANVIDDVTGWIGDGIAKVVGWAVDTVSGAIDDSNSGDAESKDFQAAISLEDVGMLASAYFSTNMQPDEDGDIPGIGPLNPNYNEDAQGNDYTYIDPATNTDQAVLPGNAGLFVSFGGKNWVSSMLTMSNVTSSYAVYKHVPVASADDSNNGAVTSTDAVYQYTQYGYVLGQMGLDKSEFQSSMNLGRKAMGIIVLGLYYASLSIDVLFAIIFDVLKALNPFRLFATGVNAVLPDNFHMENYDLVNGSNAEKTAGGAMAGVQSFLGGLYQSLYSFSWQILVPIFFLSLILTLLLYRANADKWKSKLKKYAIRIIFIVIGVPLLGGLYTVAIDKMAGSVKGTFSPATKMVASTFLDFESWAAHGRLSLAVDTNYSGKLYIRVSQDDTGLWKPSASSLLTVRNFCYSINNTYAVPTNMGNPIFKTYLDGNEYSATAYFKMPTSDTDTDEQAKANATINSAFIVDMLGRYVDGKFYTPGEFESSVKSSLTTWINSGSDASEIKRRGAVVLNQFISIQGIQSFWVNAKFIDADGEDQDYDFVEAHQGRMVFLDHFGYRFKIEDEEADAPGFVGSIIENRVSGSMRWGAVNWANMPTDDSQDVPAVDTGVSGHNGRYFINIYANGGLIMSENAQGILSFTDVNTGAVIPAWRDLDAPYGTILANNITGADGTLGTSAGAPGDGYGRGYGLSTASMYNYLNTQFTDTSLSMYSPSGVTSVFIRHAHRSVNVVGTGLMSGIYWLSCVMMLACYVIIGYSYGLGMMFSNISRMVEVVKSVPFAILGSLRHIAMLITYTFAMILEIIMTIFLFMLFSEMMFTLPDIITTPLALMLNDTNGSGSELFCKIALPTVLVIIIVFYGWFTFKALKWRKKFIRSMQEGIEVVVDKFIGVKTDAMGVGMNANGSQKGGMLGGLAKGAAAGVATGVGMNMANKLMNKNAEANKDGDGKGKDAKDSASADKTSFNDKTQNANSNAGGADFDNEKLQSSDAKDKALAESMREKDGGLTKDGKALDDGKASDGDTMYIDANSKTDNTTDASQDVEDTLSPENQEQSKNADGSVDMSVKEKGDVIANKLSDAKDKSDEKTKSKSESDAQKRIHNQEKSERTDGKKEADLARDNRAVDSNGSEKMNSFDKTNNPSINGTPNGKAQNGRFVGNASDTSRSDKTSSSGVSSPKSNSQGQASQQQPRVASQQTAQRSGTQQQQPQQAPRQGTQQQQPQQAPRQGTQQQQPQQAPRQGTQQQQPQQAPRQGTQQQQPQQAPRQGTQQQQPQQAPRQGTQQQQPQQAPRQGTQQQQQAPKPLTPSAPPQTNSQPSAPPEPPAPRE